MTKKRRHIIIAAAVATAALALWGLTTLRNYTIKGFEGEPTWIFIDGDTNADSVKNLLSEKLGVTGRRAATLWSLSGDNAGKAHGAYRIDPGMSAAKVYRMISRGAQTPVKLTFNNLRTVNQLASRVGMKLETDSARFMAACDSLLPAAGFTRAGYAAAFIPDSYEFYWTAPADKVVETLLAHRNRYWDEHRRSQAASLGLTPVEVATIASIAEEETNNREERATVGRLYLNRYKKGMMLQADPTVKFAVGDFSLRRITGKHLATASPYNTYQNPGLPPGPIRIPDASSMTALLESKPHDYLYMCAKEDFSGRHNFAVSFAEHQKNAARYHKALNQRNITGK